MYDQYVRLLYARRAAHVDHQRHVHTFRADAAVTSEQTDAAHTERACAFHRRDHEKRKTRKKKDHQHNARTRERLQLPGEYLLETVGVADGGERRGVGGERDGRITAPLFFKTPRELGREVLRVGGRTAVAADEESVARCEGLAEQRDRLVQLGRERRDVIHRLAMFLQYASQIELRHGCVSAGFMYRRAFMSRPCNVR